MLGFRNILMVEQHNGHYSFKKKDPYRSSFVRTILIQMLENIVEMWHNAHLENLNNVETQRKGGESCQ